MAAIILQFIQFLSILLIAPFLTGLIKKSKALLQGRKGPGLLQPYYDLYKHAHKDSFVSLNASWIFTVTPYIVFAATLTASALIPAFVHQPSYSFTGDLVLIIYLFALSRFFISWPLLIPEVPLAHRGRAVICLFPHWQSRTGEWIKLLL
jgi:formate hydrogenlyase subunit 4